MPAYFHISAAEAWIVSFTRISDLFSVSGGLFEVFNYILSFYWETPLKAIVRAQNNRSQYWIFLIVPILFKQGLISKVYVSHVDLLYTKTKSDSDTLKEML